MDISGAKKFLSTDLWRVRNKEVSPIRFLGVRVLRMMVLTARGLMDGRWQLRASALTYYSMLSVVPAMAFIFGIAQGFGLEAHLQNFLYKNFEGQEDIVSGILEFSRTLLTNVKGGVMAGIGLIILFWAIFRVLSQIENAFNEIWGIKRPRPLGRRVVDYLALMLIFPFLMVISSTVTVFVTSEVPAFVNRIDLLGAVSPLILFLLQLTPYFVLWLLFTYLYIFMPNAKIKFGSGALAGVVAGTGYQVFQNIYIGSQLGLARYNAIYGSFAALPLFIIWLHFSWLIVLFGAELACAHQNAESEDFGLEVPSLSYSLKRLLALRIMHLIISRFISGPRDLDAAAVARKLDTPVQLVNQVVYELVESGLVSEVKLNEEGNIIYQPAQDPEHLTIKYVIDCLEQNGREDIRVAHSETMDKLVESLKILSQTVEASPANRLLKDL